MELKFLGRGAAFNPLEGNTCAYVREGEKLLLLDCGETVFGELIRRKTLDGIREVWIAVSHMHSDHCGSLGSLTLYCAEILNFNARILLPQGDERYESEMRQLLKLFGVPERMVDYMPETADMGFKSFSGFRFCQTRHAPALDCYSFSFETPEGGVYFTADTAVADGIKAFIEAHPGFEHVYTESINAEKHPVHLPLHVLAELIPPEQRNRVSIMHLNGVGCDKAAMALGFGVVRCEV